VPLGEFDRRIPQKRRYAENAVSDQERLQQLKLCARVMKVLDHFAGNDEIISSFEVSAVRVKEWIVQAHRISRLGEHLGKNRPRAGAEIEALRAPRDASRDFVAKGANEVSVTRIVDVILVKEITRFLPIGRKPSRGR
jgi:hypothetical protein